MIIEQEKSIRILAGNSQGKKKERKERKRSIENSASEHSEQTAPEAPRREIDINVSGFAGSSIRLLRWQPPAQYPRVTCTRCGVTALCTRRMTLAIKFTPSLATNTSRSQSEEAME